MNLKNHRGPENVEILMEYKYLFFNQDFQTKICQHL